MIEIAYLKEKDKIKSMPQEVQNTILGILEILSSEYGEDRNYKDDGGYVVVIEKADDFQELKEKTYIDCDDVISEFVDKIECGNGEVFTNSLILCNNDYGISLIMPMELTTKNLKNYIID